MRIPARLMPHGGLVSYEVLLGQGGKVGGYADPVVPERACIQDEERIIRGAASETVTVATVWLDPEHYVPVNSRVTIWKGRHNEHIGRVGKVIVHEHGAGLPSHVELLIE